MEKDSEAWLKQAERDLEVAQKNFGIREWYAAAFFCQQAAEKALKAMYVEKFSGLVKAHDLVFLGRKLKAPEKFLEGFAYLNRVYVESRYPGELGTPAEKFTAEDAERCIEIAKEAVAWAKKTL